MNRLLVKRWLNEYIDGEIGLADKAELERLMAADPELRQEYKELRQLSLMLGSAGEVDVHPYRFRQRVAEALHTRRPLISPQSAFAGSMAVALLVIAVSFSLFMYQSKTLGQISTVSTFEPSEAAVGVARPDSYTVTLNTGVDADRYFSRVLLESQLGMLDPAVLDSVVQQTSVLEGASCADDPLQPVELANPSVKLVGLKVAPSVAVQLSKVAEDLSGEPVKFGVSSSSGRRMTLEQYLLEHPGQETVDVQLGFE